ncbi:hypothetical protein Tco_0954636 [Tanacetum coccineum]|uniref:Uncharacterized protein n=1 Tax=Tanacetum coccineum TaxID=301880 RepID=A0ABQ5E4Y6_9ASTR
MSSLSSTSYRRSKVCPIRDKSKKCGVYGFLDLELPGDYYKSLVYNLHDENKALKKMNKVPGVVMEDSSKGFSNKSNNENDLKADLNIIVLSSESEDVNDGPSKGKVPKDVNDRPSKRKFSKGVKDGPPTELLRWYGYVDVSSVDSFPFSTDEETSEDETTNNKMSNKTTGKNLMFYEDTKYIPVGKYAGQKSILKSNKRVIRTVLGLENLKTWDAIVQKIGKRPRNYAHIGNSANKGKGKAQV